MSLAESFKAVLNSVCLLPRGKMFAPESSSCEIINESLVPFYNRFHAGMIDNPLGDQVEHV
jgi:hypothetical protein